MLTESEIAWTAGLLDGDGCVTMQGSGGNRSRKPVVVVDSTDMEILEELLRLHGGSLVAKRREATHHRQAWSWRLYGADNILAFLRLVTPHMRCRAKRDRAELLMRQYKTVTPRNGRYTPETAQARHAFEIEFMTIGAGRGSGGRRAKEHG